MRDLVCHGLVSTVHKRDRHPIATTSHTGYLELLHRHRQWMKGSFALNVGSNLETLGFVFRHSPVFFLSCLIIVRAFDSSPYPNTLINPAYLLAEESYTGFANQEHLQHRLCVY